MAGMQLLIKISDVVAFLVRFDDISDYLLASDYVVFVFAYLVVVLLVIRHSVGLQFAILLESHSTILHILQSHVL